MVLFFTVLGLAVTIAGLCLIIFSPKFGIATMISGALILFHVWVLEPALRAKPPKK